jgi:hypothetical protein
MGRNRIQMILMDSVARKGIDQIVSSRETTPSLTQPLAYEQ